MKRILLGIIVILCLMTAGQVRAEQPALLDARLQAALAAQTAQGTADYLAAPDQFGTPLIIKLARQGDTDRIAQQASQARSGQFLLVKDSYGNTVFHAAKNAPTIQLLAALLRQHFGTKAPAKLRALMNETNLAGETALYAQISAGHTDTFQPIYAYTTLKQKNDQANQQLARLRGMDERIIAQHQNIYCQEVKTFGSAHGQTLLQAAQMQAQMTQNPHMQHLAGYIERTLPCLAL